jgi:hypothetical protein
VVGGRPYAGVGGEVSDDSGESDDEDGGDCEGERRGGDDEEGGKSCNCGSNIGVDTRVTAWNGVAGSECACGLANTAAACASNCSFVSMSCTAACTIVLDERGRPIAYDGRDSGDRTGDERALGEETADDANDDTRSSLSDRTIR